MKKFLLITLCLAMVLGLCACGSQAQQPAGVPPGISVLQNRMTLKKHAISGEAAVFSQKDFSDFLGSDPGAVTIEALPQSGMLVCNGKTVVKGQTIPQDQLKQLKFVPDQNCTAANFGFSCENFSHIGNQMECEMVFTNNPNLSPVAADSYAETVSGIACHGKLSVTEPNGDKVKVRVITYPQNGYISVEDDKSFIYTPRENFSGKDKLVYTVTDCYGNTSPQATVYITVKDNPSGIAFADMQNSPYHLYAHQMCQSNVMVYRSENQKLYFDPEAKVTKLEFLVMSMCAAKLDSAVTAVADTVIADDKGLSSGIKGYISYAVQEKLISLDNGSFFPNAEITLSDCAYIVAKALKLPVPTGESKLEPAISAMVAAGLLTPEEAAADPQSKLTKAFAAKLLCRIQDYVNENSVSTDEN